MKKNYLIVLICALLIATLMFSTVVLAKGKNKEPKKSKISGGTPKHPDGPKELDMSQMESIEELTEPLGLYSIVVNINEPCDEEWQKKYPNNWMYMANYAVEKADNKLYEWFEIDFRSVAQNVWNSDETTTLELIREARREIGHTNGSDIMIAYSNQATTDPNVAGRGYVNEGYSLVMWQGSGTDWKTTRHEVGHNYGLYHCGKVCIMHGGTSTYSYADNICVDHEEQWSNNRYRY